MLILHWNCQGLKNPLTIRHLKEIIKSHSPEIIFLTETKNGVQYVENISVQLGYDSRFAVPPTGLSGGLAALWRGAVTLDVINSSAHILEVVVHTPLWDFVISYVYGPSTKRSRDSLWSRLGQEFRLHNHPRILLGDLNEIRYSHEKEGGPPRSLSSMDVFNNFCKSAGLHEINTKGGFHTWRGRRFEFIIKSKIDRILSNVAWISLFPNASATLLDWLGSDHRPLLLNTAGSIIYSKPQFRHQAGWSQDIAVQNLVSAQFQNLMPDDSTADLLHTIQSDLKERLKKAYDEEENYWRVKSRVLWLNQGDRNTAYFHAKVKQRYIRNKISFLKDENEIYQTSRNGINATAISYFQQIYSAQSHPIDTSLLNNMTRKVTDAINTDLTRPVLEDEIKNAVFSMHPDKSPGPDGLTLGFFQHHWERIKSDDSSLLSGIRGRLCQSEGCTEGIRGFIWSICQSSKVFSVFWERFWWTGSDDKKGTAWISWKTMSKSKFEGGLGFRDVRCFNIALLAKQAWRVLTNPFSLLASIYKAKYHNKSGFLQANTGYRPSYGWRSLLEGKTWLSKNLRWIMGNGKMINVWKDNWIADEDGTFRSPDGPGKVLYPSLKVSQLLAQDSHTWNLPLLTQLFHPGEIPKILNIKPGLSNQDDYPSWLGTRIGLYTVRSGYNTFHRDLVDNTNLHSNQTIQNLHFDKKVLNFLSKLDCPPKIKFFLWKTRHDAIPSLENLKKRKLRVTDGCPRCGDENETSMHCLFHCPVSKEIWELAPLEKPVDLQSLNSPYDVLKAFMSISHHQERAPLLPFLLWQIWKARNAVIYEGHLWSIPNIINKALAEGNAWRSASYSHTPHPPEEQRHHHDRNTMMETHSIYENTCYVDASWGSTSESIGIAWIYKTNNKEIIRGRGRLTATATVAEAEAMAMLNAVQHHSSLGYSNVVFYTDSKQVQSLLHQEKIRKDLHLLQHPFKLVLNRILCLAKPREYVFHYIRRELNQDVDKL